MIQCALNGDYSRHDHPDVPVTLEQLVLILSPYHGASTGRLEPA